MQFLFITDPGHGWLRVNTDTLGAVGLTPAHFSEYSYRAGKWMFLEEDCDAPKFVEAWQARFCEEPEIQYTHTAHMSPIRHMTRNEAVEVG